MVGPGQTQSTCDRASVMCRWDEAAIDSNPCESRSDRDVKCLRILMRGMLLLGDVSNLLVCGWKAVRSSVPG